MNGQLTDPMSDSKSQNRFIVYMDNVPSYLIKGYELSDKKLSLRTWVLSKDKIMDVVHSVHNVFDPIRICTVDSEGHIDEEMIFDNYKLTDWTVYSDWDRDKPVEIKFTFER